MRSENVSNAFRWLREKGFMMTAIKKGRSKTITADNITNEQIEALRDSGWKSGEGFLDALGEYLPTTLVLEWCDEALSDPETEPKAFAHIRRNARARCAEILNQRAAQEGK